MARMRNTRRADGRLQSRIYLGTIGGKTKYKYVYASTQKELERKVSEVKGQLGRGIDVYSQRDTFGDWAERWLKLKKIQISDKKYRTYLSKEKYIRHLYNIPVSKIRTQDLQEVVIDNYCLAEYTLKQIKSMCSQIIQLAIDNRIIDYNPAHSVKIPRKVKDKSELRRALTQQEQQWIIDTPHRARTPAMIMMFAGLRRGELIPLLWSDIDLKNGTISVNKSVEAVNGKLIVKSGAKSESGKRIVYIPDKLIDYLKNQEQTSQYVCPSSKGGMMSDSSWRRLWESYLSELNFRYGDFTDIPGFKKPDSRFAPVSVPFVIPRFTAHWLRHTYITMLYFAGIDVLTAKEQAGHSDIKTTMEIYTHLDRQYKVKQIGKLNEYINGCHKSVR